MSRMREEQKTPMSRMREEQRTPMSRMREEQKTPMSRLREDQRTPMSRLREEQRTPMSRLRVERNAGVRSPRDRVGMRMVAPLSALRDTVTFMEQPRELVGRALVVVVDDRTAHGDEEDHSGPLVTELLTEAGFVVDGVVVVAADEVEIRNALNTAVIGGVDLVVSVGGTGVTPRDVTPEATRDILDRELLGISEALRASALSAGVIDAGLSRGLAGISGSTLVVNLAGSRYAVRDGMATLNPLAPQIIGQLSSLEI
jgi:molybdenum cofactor synthesis domain-containing protein